MRGSFAGDGPANGSALRFRGWGVAEMSGFVLLDDNPFAGDCGPGLEPEVAGAFLCSALPMDDNRLLRNCSLDQPLVYVSNLAMLN